MWSITKAELQRNIEAMITRRTGQSALTYVEKLIVSDAINAAMVDLCTHVGLDQLKPRYSDTTATTTADTNYVDLSTNVLAIVDGTVRIAAEDVYLTRIELPDFYALDPGEDNSGLPSEYCLSYSGTTPRLLLRVTPDSAYTVALTVKEIVDEDSLTSFPGWMHGLLASRSTQLAFEDLGIDSSVHARQYYERLQHVRNTVDGHHGPKHLRRNRFARDYRDIESYRMT